MDGKIDIRGLQRALANLPKALDAEMRRAFNAHGRFMTKEMVTKRFTGYTGRSGDRLQNRSALLRRSFKHEVVGGVGQSTPLTLVHYSAGVKYARLQEYGGTIRPKRSKWLTIPLPDALTASGVARYQSARYLFDTYPKQMSVVRSRSGRLFIVSRGKPGTKPRKNAETVWLYILKKESKVPPRLGYRDTWKSSSVVSNRTQLFNDAIGLALRRTGLGGGA
jgi:hypothetical protein